MKVFVIMPFGGDFDEVYQSLIKAPLEELGHTVNRADDVSKDQNIPRTIVHGIRDADLIIADLTGQNANVYYELGIAHHLGIDTVHIIQDYGDLVFDLTPYNAVKYSLTPFFDALKLTDEIVKFIKLADDGNYRFSNPVKEWLNGDSAGVKTVESATGQDEQCSAILQAISASEETLTVILAVNGEISEKTREAFEKEQLHRRTIDRLAESGRNSERLLETRRFASYSAEFGDDVGKMIPFLKEARDKLDQGLAYVLIENVILDTKGHRELEVFVRSCEHTKSKLLKTTADLEVFRSALMNHAGLAADVERELRLSNDTVGKLLDELRVAHSVIAKTIELGNETLERT